MNGKDAADATSIKSQVQKLARIVSQVINGTEQTGTRREQTMRIIDADEFIKIFMRSGGYDAEVINRVTQSLLDAPSIDIVFCKDCKKANTAECSHSQYNDYWDEWKIEYWGDNWFCADGEENK